MSSLKVTNTWTSFFASLRDRMSLILAFVSCEIKDILVKNNSKVPHGSAGHKYHPEYIYVVRYSVFSSNDHKDHKVSIV